MLARDSSQDPIVITYNDTVSTTNLASIAKTTASGSTDFVKGNFHYQDLRTMASFPA